MTSVHLDETDWALLEQLEREGRMSWAGLGRRVGLTAPAVAERVGRLEAAGVISRYTAEIDLDAVGRPTLAIIRLRVRGSHQLQRARTAIDQMDEILEAHRLTGEDCFALKVAVTDTGALERLVDRLLEVGDPVTSVVMSTVSTRGARVLGRLGRAAILR